MDNMLIKDLSLLDDDEDEATVEIREHGALTTSTHLCQFFIF